MGKRLDNQPYNLLVISEEVFKKVASMEGDYILQESIQSVLKISKNKLRSMRIHGICPVPVVKVGKRVGYEKEALVKWLKQYVVKIPPQNKKIVESKGWRDYKTSLEDQNNFDYLKKLDQTTFSDKPQISLEDVYSKMLFIEEGIKQLLIKVDFLNEMWR